MNSSILLYSLLFIVILSFFSTSYRVKKKSRQKNSEKFHSSPRYYGYYTAIWAGVPALIALLLWISIEGKVINHLILKHMDGEQQNSSLVMNQIKVVATSKDYKDEPKEIVKLAKLYQKMTQKSSQLKFYLIILISLIGFTFSLSRLKPKLKARHKVEHTVKIILMLCSLVAIITTAGIIFSVLFESIQFFKTEPFFNFMFGTQWSPQTAIRADQVGSSGSFGAVPLFVGTMLISFIALIISVPIGLMSAIYLSEYATPKIRTFAKPTLELLAGIPTVVYGFFAALTVAPFIRRIGETLGISVASESALAAGLVMGIMIIPFVSSLSDDVITAVPEYLREGSLGLGATKSETIKKVIIPAALPGIIGSILLAASRAIGETMIVVMAAGLSANLTINPLEAVTTVTVQIVTLLTGDQEFNSPKTLSAFALALMLFFTTLMLNIVAQRVVKKYREQYD